MVVLHSIDNILLNMIQSKKSLLAIFLILKLSVLIQSQTCHVLCNCTNSLCTSCYNNFLSNSPMSNVVGGSCPCPGGFYSNNNLCLTCMENCQACSNHSICITCYQGYTKVNGICINSKYVNNQTWVQFQTYKDFAEDQPLFGFNFFPSDSDIINSVISCPDLNFDRLFTFIYIGNSSLTFIKTYFGLPSHNWVHLDVKYLILDQWQDSQIQLDLYLDRNLLNRTYNNSLRNKDLCGDPSPDSIDQIHSYFSHTGESLAISFTIPSNVTLGIESIKLTVGTCPRNCLSCSSPYNCLVCKSYYANINGICKCDLNLSYPVSYGCVQKCQAGYVFSSKLQRCTLCSIYISNCFQCKNETTCEVCDGSTFLSNGKCIIYCPLGFYEKKIIGVPICSPCGSNCAQCLNEDICIRCINGYVGTNGTCGSICRSGTILSRDKCYTPTHCSVGCTRCSSGGCIQCEFGYWLYNTICESSCPPSTYQTLDKKCFNCSLNCVDCISVQNCQSCLPGYILANGTCQIYEKNCQSIGVYFDLRIRSCVNCPIGCLTCYRSLCYKCFSGYYLDNGLCLMECSPQKYHLVGTSADQRACYWRNQLCSIPENTNIDTCIKCRSFDFITSLNPTSSKCQNFCPSGTTFSIKSDNLLENSRYCNQSCQLNCEVCLQTSICIQCQKGFLIQINGSCVSSCGIGYVSDSIQCISCPYKCSSCEISGKCLNWIQATVNVCQENCSLCINTTCVQCQAEFYLNTNGLCQKECNLGTFPDILSLQCRKCSPQCKSCRSFRRCSSCVEGLYLNSQTCLRECPLGKFIDRKSQVCFSCSQNCRTCFGPKEHQCITCYPGYKKDYSECLSECPVHKYQDSFGYCDWCHQSCLSCFGPAEFHCQQCQSSNYLYKSQCYIQCPQATYLAIIQTKQCRQCQHGCAICQSSTSCLLCFTQFFLYNQDCLNSCPIQTYFSSVNQTCQHCSPNCIQCIENSCHRCEFNYSLQQGRCIYGCPNKTYLVDYILGISCHACSSSCLSCISFFNCRICENGYVLRNGFCTQYCQIGKYFDNINNTCKTCELGCLSCTSWGCIDCQIGHNKFNGSCYKICPIGTYPTIQSSKCNYCPSTCSICSSFYNCLQCKIGLSLVNGICGNRQNCQSSCQLCAETGNCLFCKYGFFKYVNATGAYCLQTCPTGTYKDALFQCASCQPQCLSCNSEIECISCKTPLFLFMGQCISSCFPGFYLYITNNEKSCRQCNSACKTCINSSNYCTICSSSTGIVQNGSCVQKKVCPISSFYSDAFNYCLPCIINCKICHNAKKCDLCLPNFLLTLQGSCRSSCPIGTYNQIIQCKSCSFPCLICSNTDYCSKCYDGFPLNLTSLKCQTNCNFQLNYFLNYLTNTCERCNEKCSSCLESSNNCTQCSLGYYLKGTQCVINCPHGTFGQKSLRLCLRCSSYCVSCTNFSSCEVCQALTSLYNGTCLILCPSGYYQINGICKPCINPCKQCTGGSNYQCITCRLGYFFNEGRCQKSCPDGFYQSIEYSSCRPCHISCLSCTNFQNCSSCISPYTLNIVTRQCQTYTACSPQLQNCKSCVTNSTTNIIQCSNCFQNFYLLSGICLQQCNATYYENKLTGRCQPCETNCQNCGGIGSCSNCVDQYFIYNGKCFENCPFGTYSYIDQQQNNITVKTCLLDPCLRSKVNVSSLICTLCISPFILHNGSCHKLCPVGTYQTQLQCISCRSGCLQCLDFLHCTKCNNISHYYNFQCLANCPTGTYSYNNNSNKYIQNGECLPCPGNCLICFNQTICNKCLEGQYLSVDRKCVHKCQLGFYENSITGLCQNCSSYCQKCNSLQICQICENGFYYILGFCVQICPQGTFPNGNKCQPCQDFCRSCQNDSNCTQCQSGYFLNKLSNQCVIQCPIGTYVTAFLECSPCPANCSSCMRPNECTFCKSNLLLYKKICITQCPSGFFDVNHHCLQCDSYCKECSINRNNCTSCHSGYTLPTNQPFGYCQNICPSHTFRNSTNQCQNCSSLNNTRCSQCIGIGIDQCVKCYPPFYLLNNICVSSCPDGYYGSSEILDQCLPCDNQCVTCSRSPHICTRCPWGYYLFDSKCLSNCPVGYYLNNDSTNYTCIPCTTPCSQCSKVQNCKACMPGFYLTPSGNCVSNCLSINNFIPKSFYLNTNTSRCQQCPSNCLNCVSQFKCTNCISPTILYLSKCIYDCPKSTYLEKSNNTCQPCIKNNCISCQSADLCLQCTVEIAFLFNGQCLTTCPTGYIQLNGKCVAQIQSLNSCRGYWFNNSISLVCVEFCPLGYYSSQNSTNNYSQCLPCLSSCIACNNLYSCTICQLPYILFNNQCQPNCPERYVKIAQICAPCAQNCSTCLTSTIQCISCLINYYLYINQCVQACPDRYYPDIINKICRPCFGRCLKCNSTQCLSCLNSKYSPPNCSDLNCLSYQYKHEVSGQCLNCDGNCLTCLGGSIYNCLSCRSPLILMNGQCRNSCPQGFVFNTSNYKCVACSSGCKNCSILPDDSIQCNECLDPNVLNNNVCLEDCSIIETNLQSYTSDGSQCFACQANCLDCNVLDSSAQTTACMACQSGFILYLGECRSQCPSGYYFHKKLCYPCPENCQSYNSTSKSCTKCLNNQYLFQGNCISQCLQKSYSNKTTFQCIPCTDLRCIKCNLDPNKCDACIQPFSLNQITYRCNNCSTGYLWNSKTNDCIICSPQCLNCFGNINNCSSCPSLRILLEDTCVQNCPSGYYESTVNSTSTVNLFKYCIKCPENCTKCSPSMSNTSILQCSKCISGYFLNTLRNQCIASCQIKTYVSNNTQCLPCSIYCDSCTSFTQCTRCSNGFYKFETSCLQTCPLSYYSLNGVCQTCSKGCVSCISSTNCLKCRNDFYLLNRMCNQILPCPKGQYANSNGSCERCKINCLQCRTQANCTQCSSAYYLTNGECLNTCLENQYSIIVNALNIISKICIDCTLPCDKCTSNNSCSHCIQNFYLNKRSQCVSDCGYGYYPFENIVNNITNRNCIECNDRNCKICIQSGCNECNTGYYLFFRDYISKTNATCYHQCPSGYYKDSSVNPLACTKCSINKCDKCNSTHCLQCISSYNLLVNSNSTSCLRQCPSNMVVIIINNILKCQFCKENCLECKSYQWCTKCDIGYYLYLDSNISTANKINYLANCVNACPAKYFAYRDLYSTNNSTCNSCENHCLTCLSQKECTECQVPAYILINNHCISQKCINCSICRNQVCQQCQNGFYLMTNEGRCYKTCPIGFYPDYNKKNCEICMQFCIQCLTKTICDKCQHGYNFTGEICVDEAFLQFGSLSNMSGFTGNITKITSSIYLVTSILPVAFGLITNTYFTIQFCQLIIFHARAAGNNTQIQQFLESLHSMSLAFRESLNTSDSVNSRTGTRRILATSLSDPQSFLITSASIFVMMGAFLVVYVVIFVFQKNIQSCCINCPKIKLYAEKICEFMKKRFKWIYLDLMVWMSYLPFVYFSLMQLKSISFETALLGFLSVFSIIILLLYPVYPFFVIYLLKKDYNKLVQQNDEVVQTSLFPYVYKLKRPSRQIHADQPLKDYFTFENLRLIYQPLKYIRKFVFVAVVALCPSPLTTIITLIVINSIFIGYMMIFRPKQKTYLIFDLIIEGVLLAFQIFLLIYITDETPKVTKMSIATHIIAFITTNLSIIFAIILNLAVHYKILICIYKFYKYFQAKLVDQQINQEENQINGDTKIHISDTQRQQISSKTGRRKNIILQTQEDFITQKKQPVLNNNTQEINLSELLEDSTNELNNHNNKNTNKNQNQNYNYNQVEIEKIRRQDQAQQEQEKGISQPHQSNQKNKQDITNRPIQVLPQTNQIFIKSKNIQETQIIDTNSLQKKSKNKQQFKNNSLNKIEKQRKNYKERVEKKLKGAYLNTNQQTTKRHLQNIKSPAKGIKGNMIEQEQRHNNKVDSQDQNRAEKKEQTFRKKKADPDFHEEIQINQQKNEALKNNKKRQQETIKSFSVNFDEFEQDDFQESKQPIVQRLQQRKRRK